MTSTRTAVTRLDGPETCDVCHQRATIVFRVDFDDDTYSRRCTHHVAALYDRAGSRRPGLAALQTSIGR
jgi:hypothetical protein